ncbi:hypothetical protein Q9L58_007132 [Maublancomyces gigas]|uniref:Uncharacterized protein n=1 Tax=Discina gigas TaxID=1032678 RepID=A0ABR3GDD6_9PEZI
MSEQEALMKELEKYTACDVSTSFPPPQTRPNRMLTRGEKISDALLKLNVPNAGFLCDILPRTTTTTTSTTVSLATTVLFAPTTTTEPPCSLPAGTHFADFITPHRTVVISQPAGQRCAVVGGIVAERMYQLGARVIVVSGRVRDVEGFGEREDLMVFSKGISTVGASAESRIVAVDDPITIDGTEVSAGDIVFADSRAGVVVIPAVLLEKVVEMLPGMVEADSKAMEDVRNGKSIYDAFKKHRNTS